MDGPRILSLLLAYTGKAPNVQAQVSQARLTPFFFQRSVLSSGGCPLADDWVALKQQIKEANDIVDVVGGYIPLRQVGPTFKGLCPFHDDTRPSFDVDPRRQRYRCWACNKYGDVIGFVQEFERVSFQEALELLARKAGISFQKFEKSHQGPSKPAMLECMRWATGQFQGNLLQSPGAEAARNYLKERQLSDDSVQKFLLGFAPGLGDWLVQRAVKAKISLELLETVGLIAKRDDGRGNYYDRFRDRVMFPICDLRSQVVGFGGRILPSSPMAEKAPKYYNSAETPLFSKSNQLYGIDHAHKAAVKAGYLAVVEGYTDVLMAHQYGIGQVVSTMGTALNVNHVKKLRGFVPRVVLVYDADAGGDTGVDRALEVFVSHDLDLRIGTLPAGLDPCDLLTQQGPEPFVSALEESVDVFDFKLGRVWSGKHGVEGQRRAAEEMLKTLAKMPDQRSVKLELMVNRIAHRLQIKEETIWNRLSELRSSRPAETDRRRDSPEEVQAPRSAKAAPHETNLIECLLADAALVPQAQAEISPEELEHPGLRQVLEGLYALSNEGQSPDLDHLQPRLENVRLFDYLLRMQDAGREFADLPDALAKVIACFATRREARRKLALISQDVGSDFSRELELLRQIQTPQGR